MQYTQLFRGNTLVAPYPTNVFQELFKLQNSSAEPETTEITIADPTRLGLPELDGVTSTSAINITGEAVNFSPAAAAILMFGSVERVPSGTVVAEEQDAYVDRTIALAHMPLVITSVKAADADVGDPAYVRNVDYAVTPGGIKVLLGGQLADDINAEAAPVGGGLKRLALKIAYTYPTVDVIKPFITGRKFYRIMFEQVNEAGDGEKRRIRCFYARISLNGGLPLNQAAEFGVIPVSIRLLADPSIVDTAEAAIWQFEVQNTDEAA
ncbi:hypothetical protein [Pseudomonas turukhanskensis]|uniref:Phage tail protein n=1 Tax=Pseudomonas turukhanskensis TaxID=1806536 RepID=A0A9W6K5E7_9PSED|nr:hypothetical protein [Pseudomonas turukhanskensis]GLK88319.1 hypothetical protein GCM10017655_13810 [Pseudomonas turukhanskensis]